MKKVVIACCAIVLATVGLYRLVFQDCDVYEYKFGLLGTSPYVFWSGPFVNAVLGTPEFGTGYPKPLPDIYLHWQDGRSMRLADLDQAKFVTIFGQTYTRRYDGYSYGRTEDVEIGFVKSKPKSLAYRYRQGWPCFSEGPKTKRYCFPLYWWEAWGLFGTPDDSRSEARPWI